MEWWVGLTALAAVFAVMWFFRKVRDPAEPAKTAPARPRRTASAALASRTATAAGATILSGRFQPPATAEDVESLATSVKEEAAACRRMAVRVLKAAETALAIGRADPDLVEETESALARVRATIEYAEIVMDQYLSEFDSLDQRRWISLEEIHKLETEIMAALSDLRLVQDSPQDASWFAYPP
ncbi:hypothetical protein GTW51_14885 [Aurantimonas aggregata]|uniref:Uncharacterized protein n=1 Tax=Aurantimonas aggregata TaxID=2047720 RepID=A0A6L9MK96_9HYPH|nr:hypothetical protein [Aurantimonas aggregata]NDV87988.1 hypothetical protein [Aurantimonas aggregata]